MTKGAYRLVFAALSLVYSRYNESRTASFYGRRLETAASHYETQLRPPFSARWWIMSTRGNSAFDCPGHGAAISAVILPVISSWNTLAKRSSAPTYATRTWRWAICCSRARRAATCGEVFNADKTYFVCWLGPHSSNKVVLNALLTPGDLVLFDRNNHKSNHHGARTLLQAGATPVYLETARNPYGFIGGIDAHCFEEDYLRELISEVAPQRAREARPFRLAVIQLGTYDGPFITPSGSSIKLVICATTSCLTPHRVGYEQFIPMMADCSPLLLERTKRSGYSGDAVRSQTTSRFLPDLAESIKDSHIKGNRATFRISA